MPFLQAAAGARQILGGWRRSCRLWCCGRSCLWCSRRMTKGSSSAGSDRRRSGASERRVQSCSTPSEAKPGSLWTCEPAPSPAATPRVCHRPPDCTRGFAHSSAHPSWLSSRLRRCEVAWCGPYLKDITVADHLVFITLGTSLLFVAIQICILRVLAMVLLS